MHNHNPTSYIQRFFETLFEALWLFGIWLQRSAKQLMVGLGFLLKLYRERLYIILIWKACVGMGSYDL